VKKELKILVFDGVYTFEFDLNYNLTPTRFTEQGQRIICLEKFAQLHNIWPFKYLYDKIIDATSSNPYIESSQN
jgi:hypothetical protein